MSFSRIFQKLVRKSALLLFGSSLFVSGYLVQSYAVNQHYVQHIEERLFHSAGTDASISNADCGICDLAQIVPQTPSIVISVQVSFASELAELKPTFESVPFLLPRNVGARAPPAASTLL